MSEVVAVKFARSARPYYFDANELSLKKGDYVIVSTTRGLQFGKVDRSNVISANRDLAKVIRVATKRDCEANEEILELEKEALKTCREIVEEEKLKMHIVDGRYSFDQTTLTFTFFADNRVDFRELLKILAKVFKTRIELMQIGVRDKAKEIGGIGQCGQQLCCARFINKLDNISINMAKNQDLALNPNKINGVCGRLLCCLSYENDFYHSCKKQLPRRGEVVKTKKGTGKVVKVDCLKMTYTIQTDSGEIIEVEENDGKD